MSRISVGILILLTAACSNQTPSSPPAGTTPPTSPATAPSIPTADRPPMSLVQIGDSAAELFDAAIASDWDAAGISMGDIREAENALPPELPMPDVARQLHSRINGCRDHISQHERIGTMDDANTITRLVAGLSAQFQTDVPYEAVMIGYYGRQFELGLAANQASTLTQARADLKATWRRLEPLLEERHDAEDAQRLTDVVAKLDTARRPKDFVAPARVVLTEADRIQSVLRTAAR